MLTGDSCVNEQDVSTYVILGMKIVLLHSALTVLSFVSTHTACWGCKMVIRKLSPQLRV